MLRSIKKSLLAICVSLCVAFAFSVLFVGNTDVKAEQVAAKKEFVAIKTIDFSSASDYDLAGRIHAGYADMKICGANNEGGAPNNTDDVSIDSTNGIDGSPAIKLKDKTARLEITFTNYGFKDDVVYELKYSYKRPSSTGDSFDVQPIFALMNQVYAQSNIIPAEWYDTLNVDVGGTVWGTKNVYLVKSIVEGKITFNMYKDQAATALLGTASLVASTDTIGAVLITFYTIGSSENDAVLLDNFIFSELKEVEPETNVTPNPENTLNNDFESDVCLSKIYTDSLIVFNAGNELVQATSDFSIVTDPDNAKNKALKITSTAAANSFSNIGGITVYDGAENISAGKYELSFKFKSVNGANLMIKPVFDSQNTTWLFDSSAAWTTVKGTFRMTQDATNLKMENADLVGASYNAGALTAVANGKKLMFVFATHTGDYSSATGGVLIDDIKFVRTAPIVDFNASAKNEILTIGTSENIVIDNLVPYKPDGVADFVYSSSDVNVLTVDNTGYVTAIAEGTASITIANNGIQKVVSYTVIPMLAATSLTIESEPTKIIYENGEELSLAGILVKCVFNNGTTKFLESSEYTVSGYDKTKVGEQTITITSNDYSTIKTSFVVTVKEAAAKEPATPKKGCGSSISSEVVPVIFSFIVTSLGLLGLALLVKKRSKVK